MEPARPYLIGFTILALGFAWYQKLKTKKEVDCNCETDTKPSFIQSKLFLGLITVFAIVMLSFPYYSHIFYDNAATNIVIAEENAVQTEFMIDGMTCESCEEHVTHEILQLDGIGDVAVSYDKGNAMVTYDKLRIDPEAIKLAINSTGYTVTDTK